MGKNFFSPTKKGEKRFWWHLEARFFFKKVYKGYQTTGKVKRYPNPGSSGQMDKN